MRPTLGDVKSKVERLRRIYDNGKRVQTWETIAAKLSTLAGLNNGHVWSWNYVASIHSGAMAPGKKFVRVVDLCLAQINPRQKKWFYFAKRRSVACVYDKSVLGEILTTNFRNMGYRPVTYTRYMQIKRMAHQTRADVLRK